MSRVRALPELKSYRLPNLVNWQRRLSMRMATLFRWIPLRRLCSQGAVDGHGWSPVAAENGTYIASLPIGDRYGVSVLNLPDGHAVKSVTGSTEARPNYLAVGFSPPPVPIMSH